MQEHQINHTPPATYTLTLINSHSQNSVYCRKTSYMYMYMYMQSIVLCMHCHVHCILMSDLLHVEQCRLRGHRDTPAL